MTTPFSAAVDAADTFDYVIVGGGSAVAVLANCLSADPLPINLWPAKSDAQIDRVLGVVEFVEHHFAQKLAGVVILDGPVATVGRGCTGAQPLENLRSIEPSRGRGETSAFGVSQHLEVWVENIWTKLLEANLRRHHPSFLVVRPSQD